MKYCHQCGKQLTDEARFCDGCGAAAGSGNENIAESNVRTNLPGMKQPAIPNQDLKNGVDHSLEQSAISFQTNTAGTAKSGKGKKIILIVILTILLLGGGVWGWQRFGTEAGAQKQLDLAVKYISENDFEKAILAYNEAIRIDEKEVKAYQGLAKVYTLQEKYDQAQDTYEKGMTAVAAQDKSTLQLGLAGMYIDQGELDKAEQAFKEMKNADKHCLEAYWGLAMAYQQKGDQVQAKSILTQAIKENPKEYRTYNTLALYQSQNGENEPAFENIINSLQLEINQQEAYLVMNEMYQDNWQALRDKSRSISNQKLTAMLEFYAYYKEENYQKSIEIYKEALASNKENQKARILTAIAMSKKGDAAEGKELIAALGKDQINGWLLSDLAEYYLISGDKEKARKIAIDALEAYSTNLDAVSVLQKINSKDVAGKRYSAEFLLYNWKPVCTVKNALRAIAAPFPETNLKTQIRLTTDYWIPDLNKKYLWGKDRIQSWTRNTKGEYETEDHYVGEGSESNTYIVQGNYVCWTSRVGGGTGEWIVSGRRVIIAPVGPGEKWENTYTADDGCSSTPYKGHEVRTFIGMENINVLGQQLSAAHIYVKRTTIYNYQETIEEEFEEDLWLIKDLGVVKRIWTNDGREYSEVMTEAVTKLKLSRDQQLAVAVEANDKVQTKKLLDAGANPNAEDEYNNPVLYTAAANKSLEITKILISYGANVNYIRKSIGSTALQAAAFSGSLEIVQTLLSAGANPNIKDINKSTPLLEAVNNDHPDIVQTLLAAGADIDARDLWGSTALIGAARNGKIEIVKILLNKGANVNLKNNNGETAIYYARENNFSEIVTLLQKNGAKG